MKANFVTKNRQLTFQIEGASPKAVWEELADIEEIFDTEHTCGLCGSTDLKHVRREVQGNDFFELRCNGTKPENGNRCGARFDFGQSKDKVTLFPKRKDKDGNWMPNGGWYRYSANASTGQTGKSSTADPWE